MAPSIYTPLPSDASHLNIRLIRLQPSDNPSAPICCKLVCYPLVPDRSHLYECLSYVWGSPENPETVRIATAEEFIDFDVTKNLYAALLQLRDPFFERVLWVDAICINQSDEEEKAQQVTSMTRIFGLASRVVVWLGEEADHSTLTFQHLRKLAQQQQPVTGQQQDDETDLCANASNGVCSKDACDVFALLNRTYFRRMWVLQEVTAARSVMFKCGQAELQGATFLAGLDGLPHVNDWKLRNRIRAFILLIHRSAFRESLKGQDQLHIDPLMDLIDRFHGHEATDIRDKIYALWGLSTESELANTLRPDYSMPWKRVFKNLGLHVFGKDSDLTPSESKQMLYVRSLCYYLGKVTLVYNAGMWDMEQRLEIASLKVSKFLDVGDIYNLTLKMRSSAQRIREEDIVCFLPRTKKLIFARPESHCLRIISVVECRSVQVSGHHENPDNYWRSWEPFLDSISGKMLEVPFLWSWEQDPVHERQEIWCLIRNHSASSIPKAHDDAQHTLEQTVLFEMADLHMQMDNYAAACLNLNTTVNDHSSKHGPQVDGIDNSRERLDVALKRRSMYEKAKNILASRKHNNVSARSSEVFELCFHVIFHVGMQLVLKEDSEECTRAYIRFRPRMQFTSADIVAEFAAVIMSQGTGKNMILDAIKMCDLNWDTLPETTAQGMPRPNTQWLPATSDPHNDYLGFLLLMSDQSLRLSQRELSEAFRAKISARNLNQLLKHCETTVDNLSDLIASVWRRTKRYNSHDSAENFLRSVLKGNADRVSITSDAILSAVQLDHDANVVSVLVEVAQESGDVAPGTLDDLMRDGWHILEDVVRDFANVLKTQWHIGEYTLLEIFSHKKGYSWSRRSKMILIAFLENEKVTIDITAPVLGNLLSASEETVLFMMYRQDPSIMNGKSIVANYPSTKKNTERMLSNLTLLQDGARSIRNKDDALSIPNSLCGYAQLLNLIRYRREEFEITPDLFLRTTAQPALGFRPFEVVEKIGCCMIRYANDKEIDVLIESSDFLNAIALGGYVPIVKDLRNRMNNVSPLFEAFNQVTIWSREIQNKHGLLQYEAYEPNPELIESLRTISVPPELQQTLLQLACGSLCYTKGSVVLEDLLGRDVIKAPLSLDFQEKLARLVFEAPSSSTVLNALLEHRVIGANTTFKDGSTILHLLFDHPSLDHQAESIARNVDIVMQHGGAASINAKNARGETPRKMVKEILKHPTKGFYSKSSYFSEILELFDKMAPASV